MIGSPDAVVNGPETCSLYPGGNPSLCKSYEENFIAMPESKGLLNSVKVQPELLREITPEIPDWDFELKAKLLIVEGNVGVGKTTLTKKLADKLNYRIFLEPTTENPFLGRCPLILLFRQQWKAFCLVAL